MQREKKKVKRFSKFMNNKMDYILFITVLILLSLGVVMVLSASAPSALSSTGKSYTYFLKQFEFALVGIGLMLFFSKTDYRFLKKYYWVIYVISVAILLLVLVPKLGKSVNGAKRWIEIKGIGQFQPSEFTKIGLIIFYAGYLSDHKNELKQFGKGFVLPMAFLIPPVAILYFVQNHLSVSLVVGIVTCVMMLMAGCRLLHFLFAGLAGVAGVSLVIIKELLKGDASDSFRMDRIMTFFDPWSDATGTGYQMVQSLYAIGSGGLFGVGLGNSKQKYLYIPEPQNDICNSSRRTGVRRLCYNHIIICNFCMERNCNFYEGTRHVWKFACNRSYNSCSNTSNNKHSGCYSIYTNNRYGASIFQLPEELLC